MTSYLFDTLTINIVSSYMFFNNNSNNNNIINSICMCTRVYVYVPSIQFFLITLRIVNEMLLIIPFDIDELQFLLLVRLLLLLLLLLFIIHTQYSL